MSGGNSSKEGLEVIRLTDEPGRRYELDEAALERVLLSPDVRDRPVMLVSVAGAYRGGKSFILDFFLRYLTSTRSSQKNGEWLDIERPILDGFKWRGGSERHTTGIHLWPDPVLVTLDNGQKIAVLLMDTQGTFDDKSTLGDNSTIFALSTLISSVQIYNISANIREDDLQHLQLFTEYGRLASDGKAFQTLMFLVRDWMCSEELAYGFEGGQTLLDKRLEASANQKKELRDVREHIRSCFDNIKCFLMPHPGLIVGRKHFTGCAKDLEEEFRMALLDLVSTLFDHQNLAPKLIAGQHVRGKDLLDLFKKYVDVFNSDDLPEAITIFQATADACMMAALRDAREVYQENMERNLSSDKSVSASCLQQWHSNALQTALTSFSRKKKLGSQESADSHLAQLEKELDSRLSLYMLQNDAKTRDSMAVAKKTYEDAINNVCETQTRLCLHPCDLDELHGRALKDALEIFDAARNVGGEDDEERDRLEKNLQELYKHLCFLNEQNNSTAVLTSRNTYELRMKELLDGAVSTEVLRNQHEVVMKKTIEGFKKNRNLETGEEKDPYIDQLVEQIESSFEEFKARNINSNRVTMQGAEYKYNNFMTSAWGPQSCCFHPLALEELHRTGKEEALRQFLIDRPESEDDDFKNSLSEVLEKRYKELVQINEFNNIQAVEQAFREYTRRMDKHSQPSLVSVLIAPFFVKLFLALPEYHRRSKNAAMKVFSEKRRGDTYSEDEYKENLDKKIEDTFPSYKNPVQAFLRELGIDRN